MLMEFVIAKGNDGSSPAAGLVLIVILLYALFVGFFGPKDKGKK